VTVLSFQVRSSACLLAATLSFSALTSGCADNAEQSATAPETVETTNSDVTVPISPVTVTVDNPGDEPREVLAPHPVPGLTQQVLLRTTNQITQTINQQADQDFSAPALSIPLTAAATDSGIDLTIGKMTTTDTTLAADVGPAEGSHAGLLTNDSGAITALRLSPAPEAADAVRAAIEQAFYQAVYSAVSFPVEPIGVGAMWTLHRQVPGGVPLDQVVNATLLERDGDRLVIAIVVHQTPKSAEWDLPNNAGMLNIDGYVMQGSGTLTIDLGLPLPVAGTIVIGGDQTYTDPHSETTLKQSTGNIVQWGG